MVLMKCDWPRITFTSSGFTISTVRNFMGNLLRGFSVPRAGDSRPRSLSSASGATAARDNAKERAHRLADALRLRRLNRRRLRRPRGGRLGRTAVSYTHLTLPTIYSV